MLTVGCLPLAAWHDPEPGRFLFQTDLLYLAPSYNETYFVINGSGLDGTGNPTPKGKRINNPVGYNLGFRVAGMYAFYNPCLSLGLRWTHLYATSRETVSCNDIPGQLWPTEIIPNVPNVSEPYAGTASSHIGVMYQKGECLFDQRLWDCWCWHFTLREAVEWSYLRYHEKVTYVETAGPQEKIQFHGHSKGLGPQLGMIAVCAPGECWCWFPECLSIKAMATASLICANSKAKVKLTDALSEDNKITQSSFWRFIPEWFFSFGFDYTHYFCRCMTSMEIAYEMTTYCNGISKLLFVNGDSPGVSFNQYSDFYVHGLHFSLSIFF